MPTSIKIKITKDILSRSAMCGINKNWDSVIETLSGYDPEEGCIPLSSNCAFALAIRDIFPNAEVGEKEIWPFYHGEHDIVYVPMKFGITPEMSMFINEFDSRIPKARAAMEEREFELEIPDWAIERLTKAHVDFVQAVANSPTLELV
jgi:hypothetical protein